MGNAVASSGIWFRRLSSGEVEDFRKERMRDFSLVRGGSYLLLSAQLCKWQMLCKIVSVLLSKTNVFKNFLVSRPRGG